MKTIWNYIIGFLDKINKGQADVYAASASFFIIVSMIPFLMVLLSCVQFMPLEQQDLSQHIELYMPNEVSDFLNGIVSEVYRNSSATFTISLIVALWLSAKGVQYLSAGLNSMYEIGETRPPLILRIKAMFHTVLILGALLLLLALTVFGNFLQSLLFRYIPVLGDIWKLIMDQRAVITGVSLTVLIDIAYTVMPNRRATLLGQLPGALFCTMGWAVLSLVLNIYVDQFNGFSMYGSLTTLILLMMWLYFLVLIFLMGGAINFYFNGIFRKYRMRFRHWRRRRREARKGIHHDEDEKQI